MDSDFQKHQYHFQDFSGYFHHPKPQTNNLTRFHSAPSSYFTSLIDVQTETTNNTDGSTGDESGGERRDFPNARPLSPETENIFDRFMSSIGAESGNSLQKLSNIPENTALQPDFATRIKQENYSSQSQLIYQSQSKPPLSNQHNSAAISEMQNSFTANNNHASSLTRHNSSPAGLFASLNVDTGYGMIGSGETGNHGSNNGGNFQINYSSGQPASTSGLVNPNSEIEEKMSRVNSLDKGRFNNQKDEQNYEYSMTSWDDSIISENFSTADDSKTLTELTSPENQSEEGKNRCTQLTHHLSLPKTLPEMSGMENFLQFQDTVPCRIRAKRGCATHPRSIAERVRRTRISERMRKLQDLVPNMDKQTNTSGMLDLAVDYIKDLQKQLETLIDNRAQCTCSR